MRRQQTEHLPDQSKEIGNFPLPDTFKRTKRHMFYGKMEVLAIHWTLNKNTRAELEFLEESNALALCHSGGEDSPWY